MRLVANLFSVQNFVLSLASISALVTVSAMPVRSDSVTLARRNSVTVDGKVAIKGKQLSHASHSKSEVHQLTSWDGKAHPNAVLKTYSRSKVTEKEVKGLKAAGQYIHHDKTHVVMHEVKGEPLANVIAKLPQDQRKTELDKKWKPLVAAHAAEIARTKGILHGDLNLNNVIIHPKGHVQLVDWEHHIENGVDGFTTDATQIKHSLDLWDSVNTPPEGKKSSGHKSGSPKRRSHKS